MEVLVASRKTITPSLGVSLPRPSYVGCTPCAPHPSSALRKRGSAGPGPYLQGCRESARVCVVSCGAADEVGVLFPSHGVQADGVEAVITPCSVLLPLQTLRSRTCASAPRRCRTTQAECCARLSLLVSARHFFESFYKKFSCFMRISVSHGGGDTGDDFPRQNLANNGKVSGAGTTHQQDGEERHHGEIDPTLRFASWTNTFLGAEKGSKCAPYVSITKPGIAQQRQQQRPGCDVDDCKPTLALRQLGAYLDRHGTRVPPSGPFVSPPSPLLGVHLVLLEKVTGEET